MTLHARFEYKYVLDHMTAKAVRGSIVRYFRKDAISQNAPRGKYLVRSLYFDTDEYTAYFEKVVGESTRKKLRLRSYWASPEEAEFINVEQKIRVGRKMFKYTHRVSVDDYTHFMEHGTWKQDHEILQDFEREVRLCHLKPKSIVQYYREAFVSRAADHVRLTLDSELAYSKDRKLFPTTENFKNDLSKKLILEIKTTRDDIDWLNRIIREQDLAAVPNSKYVDSIEHTQNGLWL